MHNSDKYNFPDAPNGESGPATELGLLRDVIKMLPAGGTVQDEHGRFVLMNDAAAAQLGAGGAVSGTWSHLDERLKTGRALLRDGRLGVAEESLPGANGPQTLLTAHRPVHIDGRSLLLSSSTDISGQKAFEEQLFRSAY